MTRSTRRACPALLVLATACGGGPREPTITRPPADAAAPSLDELIALLGPHGGEAFTAAASAERGCPTDKTVGEYVDTLVRIGREGEDSTDIHSLTGGCTEWPAGLVPIDPPRDDAYWYCKVDSKTSDPAGESPWNYDLRVRVRRTDRHVDLETAACFGMP